MEIMNRVGMLFDIEKLKQIFFGNVKKSVDKFCETKDNKDIYAIVFDCDESVGQISL